MLSLSKLVLLFMETFMASFTENNSIGKVKAKMWIICKFSWMMNMTVRFVTTTITDLDKIFSTMFAFISFHAKNSTSKNAIGNMFPDSVVVLRCATFPIWVGITRPFTLFSRGKLLSMFNREVIGVF